MSMRQAPSCQRSMRTAWVAARAAASGSIGCAVGRSPGRTPLRPPASGTPRAPARPTPPGRPRGGRRRSTARLQPATLPSAPRCRRRAGPRVAARTRQVEVAQVRRRGPGASTSVYACPSRTSSRDARGATSGSSAPRRLDTVDVQVVQRRAHGQVGPEQLGQQFAVHRAPGVQAEQPQHRAGPRPDPREVDLGAVEREGEPAEAGHPQPPAVDGGARGSRAPTGRPRHRARQVADRWGASVVRRADPASGAGVGGLRPCGRCAARAAFSQVHGLAPSPAARPVASARRVYSGPVGRPRTRRGPRRPARARPAPSGRASASARRASRKASGSPSCTAVTA